MWSHVLRLGVLGGVVLGAVPVVAGCVGTVAGDAGGEVAQAAQPDGHEAVRRESLGSSLTGLVGGLAGDLGLCQPLTCCFPSGGGWTSDPFEQGLRALGCTTPAAYSESAGASMWWLYSQCPAGDALNALVAQYSAPPYEAQPVVNECLALGAVTELDLNAVFIEFDPTCNSCRPAQ
jgi:hypothetical protein